MLSTSSRFNRPQNSYELLDARILCIGKSLTTRCFVVPPTSSFSSTALGDEHERQPGVDDRCGDAGPSRIGLAGLGAEEPSRREECNKRCHSEEKGATPLVCEEVSLG